MQQVDAYAERDYQQAYKLERQAYQSTYGAGTTLASAGLPASRRPTWPRRRGPAVGLRHAAGRAHGADRAQRATFAGAPEFEAAAGQINANTATLAKAMSGIVGPEKAAEFQTAWANHVEGLMVYTAAVAAKDETAKTRPGRTWTVCRALALYFSDVVRNPRSPTCSPTPSPPTTST